MSSSFTPDYIEETTVMPTTTTSTTSDTLNASPTIMDMWMSQLQKDHPEISFVIPSQHDNQHIDNMMNFKRLLEQVGNTAYDTISSAHQHTTQMMAPSSSSSASASLVDSLGQPITHEQISNSAVLNLADLKNNAMSGLERFFAGADMNSLINYLWIGVVTSLVILTVIFVLFSCYFYRKFREWKRCNKDIRAHLNNDLYAGTIVPCDANSNPEAAYYQMDAPPPPCYTIATGLPTYDEALHHQQQHFAFGMKFIYPTLAAVHHQAANLMSSWEKYDMANTKDQGKPVTVSVAGATHSNSNSSPMKQGKLNKCKSSLAGQSNGKSSTALLLPPGYDVAATMALLAPEPVLPSESVSIHMPVQTAAGKDEAASGDLTDIITV